MSPTFIVKNTGLEDHHEGQLVAWMQYQELLHISRDPSAYGLPVRATQKAIDAAVASDAEVVALQDRIDARQEMLLTHVGTPLVGVRLLPSIQP